MADRILIIDDDERLAAMLASYLTARGYAVEQRADARSGLKALEADDYSALILDVMLPDLDGFEICRRVRARSQVPILMLTARGDDLDRIVGLEIGADDYLAKPFNPREVVARLGAILRRTRRTADGGPSETLRFEGLTIDRRAREVCVNSVRKELTGRQFDLLALLAERPGRIQSRDQLREALGSDESDGDGDSFDRSIDVHVSRIRNAIEDDPKRPRFVQTVRGAGYVFTPPRPPETKSEGTKHEGSKNHGTNE
jgi:two-component system phosphate regulon response regulator OmpR